MIVFDDADLDRALDAVVFMIYSLNGERCTSSSRLLVQKSIYEDFTERVAARVRRIRVGHPLDPDTEVGPLIHPQHLDKVCSYFDVGRAEGARIAAGGAPASVGSGAMEGGLFVEPTLIVDADNTMRIAQEEIFGPVLTAIPFDDEEDARNIANDVRYGLTAYLWTRDLGRAHRLARDVDAGMIWVNSQNVRHLPTPFGRHEGERNRPRRGRLVLRLLHGDEERLRRVRHAHDSAARGTVSRSSTTNRSPESSTIWNARGSPSVRSARSPSTIRP